MRSVNSLLIASVIYAVRADPSCLDGNMGTSHSRLKQAILCQYDSSIRPVVNHQNTTQVSFRLILKYFSLDTSTSMLTVDSWMPMYWKDQHLKWNPDNYNGIKTIYLSTSEIWTPDLSVFNRHSQSDDPKAMSWAQCTVFATGFILCVPPIHIEALCVPDMSRYPFDEQECTISLGSWVHRGEEVNVSLAQNPITVQDLEPNGEWELSKYSANRIAGNYDCCPNDTYPSVNIKLTLKRLHGAHAASVVVPSVVAILVTFTTLAMSPLNKERIYLSYVNLITQLFHVQYVSWMVELKGDKIPLIVLFARDSLLLSTIVIVFTLIIKHIMEYKTTPPTWISSIVSLVTSCQPGQIILLSSSNSLKGLSATRVDDDGETIINNSEQNAQPAANYQDWTILGNILDKLFLISYVIVYFSMCISLLP